MRHLKEHVFEVAVACRGLLVVPRTDKQTFGGACVAFVILEVEQKPL